MNSKLMKGILMMGAVIFAAIQTGDIVWPVTLITAACVGIGYFAKNWWFESASTDNVFDWRDVASALIMAAVVAIPESIGQIVVNGVFNLSGLLAVIGSVIMTYFTATFFSGIKK